MLCALPMLAATLRAANKSFLNGGNSPNTQPLLAELRPSVANLHRITDQIQGPGALGEWLIPTNINKRLDTTLGSADDAVQSLTDTLESLAGLTSNLNAQVQANTNLLGGISKAVTDADDLVQGLKRHWLLRSAFKKNTK